MDTQENHSSAMIKKICLYMAPLLSAAVHYYLEKETLQTLFSNGIFMLLLSGLYLLYMRTAGREIFSGIKHSVLYWGCFTLSLLFLGMHSVKGVGVLWLLVVAFAGMEAGLELAVAQHIYMMLAYVILVLLPEKDLYAFAVMLIFGFIVATLFSLYRSRESTVYLAIILLAVYGVLQVVFYRLDMGALLENAVLIIAQMAGIVVMVALGRCFLKYIPAQALHDRKENGAEMAHQGQEQNAPHESSGGAAASNLTENTPEPEENEAAGELSLEERLARIFDRDFPLVQGLWKYSHDLYSHCMRVADLSERASPAIGEDAQLARVGGFYHEIGRITGEDNYIMAGEKLGEEYDFPQEVLAIIRQHSPGYELPQSAEATVVMLSDCILSTSDYLIKNGMRDRMGDEDLVHNVFQNRLSKGNLKESGMSVDQVEDLQAYFIGHAFEKGDRDDDIVREGNG